MVLTFPWTSVLSFSWLLSTWIICEIPSGSMPLIIGQNCLGILQGERIMMAVKTWIYRSIILEQLRSSWIKVPSWTRSSPQFYSIWHCTKSYCKAKYYSIVRLLSYRNPLKSGLKQFKRLFGMWNTFESRTFGNFCKSTVSYNISNVNHTDHGAGEARYTSFYKLILNHLKEKKCLIRWSKRELRSTLELDASPRFWI